MRLHPKQLLLTAFLVLPLAMVTILVVSIASWLEDGPLMHADAVGGRAGQAEGTTAMRQWLESDEAPASQPRQREAADTPPDPRSLSGGSRLFQHSRPSRPDLPAEPVDAEPAAFEVQVRDRSAAADQDRPIVLSLVDAQGAQVTRPMTFRGEGRWSLQLDPSAWQARFGREMQWPLRASFTLQGSPLVEADRQGRPVEFRALRRRDIDHSDEGEPPIFEFTIEGFAEPEDPASG